MMRLPLHHLLLLLLLLPPAAGGSSSDVPIDEKYRVREICATSWSSPPLPADATATIPQQNSGPNVLQPSAPDWSTTGTHSEWVRFEIPTSAPIARVVIYGWGGSRNPRSMALRKSSAAAATVAEAQLVASFAMARDAKVLTIETPPGSSPSTVWFLEINSGWSDDDPVSTGTSIRDVEFYSTEVQVMPASTNFWINVEVNEVSEETGNVFANQTPRLDPHIPLDFLVQLSPTPRPTAQPTTHAYHLSCLMWNTCRRRRRLDSLDLDSLDSLNLDLGGIEQDLDAAAGWIVPLVSQWSMLPNVDGEAVQIYDPAVGVWVKADLLAEQTSSSSSTTKFSRTASESKQLKCVSASGEAFALPLDAVTGERRDWREVCETDPALCQDYNPCCDPSLHCVYVHFAGSDSCTWDEWLPINDPRVSFGAPPVEKGGWTQRWTAPKSGWDLDAIDVADSNDVAYAGVSSNASIKVMSWSKPNAEEEHSEFDDTATWLDSPPSRDGGGSDIGWKTTGRNYIHWVVFAILNDDDPLKLALESAPLDAATIASGVASLRIGHHTSLFNVTSVTVHFPGRGVGVNLNNGVGNPGQCWLQTAPVADALAWDDVVRLDIASPGARSVTAHIPSGGRRSAFWRLVLERPILPKFAGNAPRTLAVSAIEFTGHVVAALQAQRSGVEPEENGGVGTLGVLPATVIAWSSQRDAGAHAAANLATYDAAEWQQQQQQQPRQWQWQSADPSPAEESDAGAGERRRLRGVAKWAQGYTGPSRLDEHVVFSVGATAAAAEGAETSDAEILASLPRLKRVDLMLWSGLQWEGADVGLVGSPTRCAVSISSSVTPHDAEWTLVGAFTIPFGWTRVSYGIAALLGESLTEPRARYVRVAVERPRLVAHGEELPRPAVEGSAEVEALPTFVSGIAVRRVRLLSYDRVDGVE